MNFEDMYEEFFSSKEERMNKARSEFESMSQDQIQSAASFIAEVIFRYFYNNPAYDNQNQCIIYIQYEIDSESGERRIVFDLCCNESEDYKYLPKDKFIYKVIFERALFEKVIKPITNPKYEDIKVPMINSLFMGTPFYANSQN